MRVVDIADNQHVASQLRAKINHVFQLDFNGIGRPREGRRVMMKEILRNNY